MDHQRIVLNLLLSYDLVNRLKNAVYHSEGWTIGEFVSAAVNKALTLVEKEHGGPFPDRGEAPMRKGPPKIDSHRTKFSDLSNWLPEVAAKPDPQAELTAALSALLDSPKLKGLSKEALALLKNKVVDRGTSHTIKRRHEGIATQSKAEDSEAR